MLQYKSTNRSEVVMLKSFSVTNYRGFKDTVKLDLTAGNYGFSNNLVKDGIVNKALVYGKNGTGKSNLGFAIMDIIIHLTDKQSYFNRFFQSYCNKYNQCDYADFEYVFQFGKDEVIYKYQKYAIDKLKYEQFILNNKTLLIADYDAGKFSIDKDIKEAVNLKLPIEQNTLSLVKYIFRNTNINKNSPISKMMQFADNMLWVRRLEEGNSYSGLKTELDSNDIVEIIENNNALGILQNFLKSHGIDYDLVIRDKILLVSFPEGNVNFFDIASSGTRSLLLLFSWMLDFDKVSFLFFDEFDAFYHYELAENIVKMINEYKNFQTIFTTHNTALLNTDVTRPDCSYIIANDKIKSLANATDRELRQAHNLEKMYRNGIFNE